MVKGVSMSEGLAHLKTKEILIRTKKIMLPYVNANTKVLFEFDDILFEEKIGRFKADCVVSKGDRHLVIEIVDTGKTSNKKMEYYIENKIPSIEIEFNMPRTLVEGTKYIDEFLEKRLEHHIHNLGDSKDLDYTNEFDEVPYDIDYQLDRNFYKAIMNKHWICNPKYDIYKDLKEPVSTFTKTGRPDLRTKKGRKIQEEINIAKALEEQKKTEHFEMMQWKWENAKHVNQLVRRKKWRRGEDWGTY